MKIGILGCRGIPNHYGGFEQFATVLSAGLVRLGEEVWVYNSHNHPNQEKKWEGVNILHRFDPEYFAGPAGQYLYDLSCILDSRRRGFDIILQLGYTSSGVWYWLHPGQAVVVTNMDGMEWQRRKYSPMVRQLLKATENLAVSGSECLVADSEAIQAYLGDAYHKSVRFIPYAAEVFTSPEPSVPERFGLHPSNYYLMIARLQPDNHTEEIIRGVLAARTGVPLVIIGDYRKKFGYSLFKKYSREVKFVGGIFDPFVLNTLRYYSRLYFHGHSAGGTNPSLLEAMAASARIVAHDNPFNREVASDGALYFRNEQDIASIVSEFRPVSQWNIRISNNLKRITVSYCPDHIVASYHRLFKELLANRNIF